jgi:hypothetical protein
MRPDGCYVLELKDVGNNGRLRARYFNPNPINVSKAHQGQTFASGFIRTK